MGRLEFLSEDNWKGDRIIFKKTVSVELILELIFLIKSSPDIFHLLVTRGEDLMLNEFPKMSSGKKNSSNRTAPLNPPNHLSHDVRNRKK